MSMTLAQIFRHPIKAIGREELASVTLEPGHALPWDRAFAVAHSRARPADLEQPWARCANYMRAATSPALMAVEARFDSDSKAIHLTHPDRPDLRVTLGTDEGHAALLEWLGPLWPVDSSDPMRVVHNPDHAQTDAPDPWLSLNNRASHQAVADLLSATDLSVHRWRGNLWLDGLAPWAEFDWIGRDVQIGDAVLHVHEPITRCKATTANPATGQRDQNTLGALDHLTGAQDFGVYVSVKTGGTIAPGAKVVLL